LRAGAWRVERTEEDVLAGAVLGRGLEGQRHGKMARRSLQDGQEQSFAPGRAGARTEDGHVCAPGQPSPLARRRPSVVLGALRPTGHGSGKQVPTGWAHEPEMPQNRAWDPWDRGIGRAVGMDGGGGRAGQGQGQGQHR